MNPCIHVTCAAANGRWFLLGLVKGGNHDQTKEFHLESWHILNDQRTFSIFHIFSQLKVSIFQLIRETIRIRNYNFHSEIRVSHIVFTHGIKLRFTGEN